MIISRSPIWCSFFLFFFFFGTGEWTQGFWTELYPQFFLNTFCFEMGLIQWQVACTRSNLQSSCLRISEYQDYKYASPHPAPMSEISERKPASFHFPVSWPPSFWGQPECNIKGANTPIINSLNAYWTHITCETGKSSERKKTLAMVTSFHNRKIGQASNGSRRERMQKDQIIVWTIYTPCKWRRQ